MSSKIRHFRNARKEDLYLQLTPCRTLRTCGSCGNQINPGDKYLNTRITPAAQPRKICQSCAKKLYPGAMEVMQ
ncbi:hypothetical protein [uncultured Methanomethylovorans sp.]|uniref:hypothetical protein n=1 Tax=uncultured Methanomethylovorans sp. TaxID=183759 RepID=UPI002AA6ACCF|nr:hypothetical protein [uncultured Methanomethylovorans sp.]